jgi:predicted short-subunit dehydrogenase-like oxidoreductase (DUF2520 family)
VQNAKGKMVRRGKAVLLDSKARDAILATTMSASRQNTADSAEDPKTRAQSPRRRRERIGIIGAGRVGSALAWHCHRLGYGIAGVADNRPKQAWVVYGLLKLPYRRMGTCEVAAESDVLFITTLDGSIEPEFQAIRRLLTPGSIVAHCSGAMGTDAFKGAIAQGLDTLALHPVQAFASHAQAIRTLPGSFFAVEGTARGLKFARKLVRGLRGSCVVVKGQDRPLYHAACVFGSNFINGLLDAAEVTAGKLGISRRKAARIFVPLARAVLDNVAESGATQSLTGPVQRGDWETVARHLVSLRERVPELVQVYRVLSLRLVELARRGGLDSSAARRLRRILEEP